MWDKILKSLAHYHSGVLTAIDTDGYPYSLRCTVQPDASTQSLHLKLNIFPELTEGPASLLFHYHNEQLWDLRSFVLRGTLEKAGNSYVFRPVQYIDGAETSIMKQIHFLRECRKAAKNYLSKRGLSRPNIPWDKFKQLYEQAIKD